MTLWVTAYRVDRDGRKTELPLRSHLAGVESARADFYGGEGALALGLTLLPALKDGGVLAVRGAALSTLLNEVLALRAGLPSGEGGDAWRFRLDNILDAIDAASSHGEAGGVEIA